MTNSLKDIVSDLFAGASKQTLNYFMDGEFESMPQGKWDTDDIALLKGKMYNINLTTSFMDTCDVGDVGDEYWSVYKFEMNKNFVYVKFSGIYNSRNGRDFKEWFFVKHTEKIINEYNRTNN